MSALILKSKNALNEDVVPIEYGSYKSRVLADGGYIKNDESLRDAFRFIRDNNIPIETVYSATSAEWGVKKNSEGWPEKLYSLGSSSGDIIVDLPIGRGIELVEQNGRDMLWFRSVSTASAKTSEPISNFENMAISVVTKMSDLDSPTSYGKTLNFYRYTVAVDNDEQAENRLALSLYKRATKEDEVSTAETQVYSQAGRIPDTISLDPMTFSNDSQFIYEGGHVLYVGGSQVAESSYSNSLPQDQTVSLGAPTIEKQYTILYGEIAEAWFIVNTRKEVAQALSTRY